MYQKDYIMRMIEAFAKMVAFIIRLLEKGDWESARAMIHETYDTILKIDPEQLYQLSDSDWSRLYTERSLEELEMIAELFRLEGEIRIETGDPEEGLPLLSRSLQLFKYVDLQSRSFSVVRSGKISAIEEVLSGYKH